MPPRKRVGRSYLAGAPVRGGTPTTIVTSLRVSVRLSVHDGPALAEADVAVVMGKGAASSLAIADAVVVGDGLRPLATAFSVATRVGATIHAGTTRSLVYNVTALLAASFGWVNPRVAALRIPLSSGMVAWASFRADRLEDT